MSNKEHPAALPRVPEGEPQPAWAVATLFPSQGSWSERDYLELPTNRLVELSDGTIEVLSVPNRLHQTVVAYLFRMLEAFVNAGKLGHVFFAPLPLHLWPGKYREPDIMFVRSGNSRALEGEYLEGADLVMEVVSRDDPDRDWILKRSEYERAGIPEYWIVDRERGTITVLALRGVSYAVHGEFTRGANATSALLPGFSVQVDAAFAADQAG